MRLAIVVLVLVAACGASKEDAGADDFVDPYMDDPLPPSCRDTSGSTTSCEDTTAGAQSECDAATPCPDGQICAAEFDGDIGIFRCESSCIADDDEARWCFDDDACCNTDASCIRGLCVPPGRT